VPAISAFVITRNEENSIGRCLSAVAGVASQIVVVDAESTDRTVDIAREFTTEVYIEPWAGFVEQKQSALARCTSQWAFWVDADEEVTPELRMEIRDLDFTCDAYAIPRLTRYMGRWITHGGWYPDHVTRLFRKDRSRFSSNIIHESIETSGPVVRLRSPLLHYSYRNIAHHVEKLNAGTSLAAVQMRLDGSRGSVWKAAAHAGWKFFRTYVLRRGFLDGGEGLIVAVMGAMHTFVKYAKLYEAGRATPVDGKGSAVTGVGPQ
jgi:glycosyltransferase involved in cell wall biosynthesis